MQHDGHNIFKALRYENTEQTLTHIYQKEDVKQLEGKLNPEGENLSLL
jgi:hypothetical protein